MCHTGISELCNDTSIYTIYLIYYCIDSVGVKYIIAVVGLLRELCNDTRRSAVVGLLNFDILHLILHTPPHLIMCV